MFWVNHFIIYIFLIDNVDNRRDIIPQDILPIFGDYDKAVVDGGEVTRTIKELIRHPYHDQITQNNDFALLKLDKALKFDQWNIQPICLPKSCSDGCQTGSMAYIAGWGLLAESKLYFQSSQRQTFIMV